MRKIFLALCIILLMIPVCHASVLSQDRAYFPAVLMYHELKTTPLNEFDTTPEAFASQLDWLKD
ncbi:MAG: hypothetical protein IJ587_09585, partial [Synergistaceae bacterium]|nr:hypothetical protein [Synergistaceae bacterium]